MIEPFLEKLEVFSIRHNIYALGKPIKEVTPVRIRF